MKKGVEPLFFLWTWTTVFLFCPFQVPILEWKNNFLLPFWNAVFGLFSVREILIFSDSRGFFLIITILLAVSMLSFIIFRKFIRDYKVRVFEILHYFLLACVFIIFVKYGLDKLMLQQFPSPESNLMFTELGNLDKDILFWTTMGTSRLFNWITGGIEVFAALFLLFKRTRRMGLIALLLFTIYIVILNFSFNIGVKLFSLILLGTLITLNWNTLTFLFRFFLSFGEEDDQPVEKKVYLPILKVVLGASLIVLLVQMNTSSKTVNNLQGAYTSIQSETLDYIFINQQNYWIEQSKTGERQSFEIIGQGKTELKLRDDFGATKIIQFHKKDENNYRFQDTNGKYFTFKKMDLSKVNILHDETQLIVR